MLRFILVSQQASGITCQSPATFVMLPPWQSSGSSQFAQANEGHLEMKGPTSRESDFFCPALKASFSERCKCNFAAWSLWEIFSCWDLCFCLGQLHQDTDREIETGGETMSEIDTAGVPSWGCLTGLFWVRCFLATSTSNVIRIYQICLNIWHPLNHLNTKVTVLPLLKMDVLGVVRRSRTFWKPHPFVSILSTKMPRESKSVERVVST